MLRQALRSLRRFAFGEIRGRADHGHTRVRRDPYYTTLSGELALAIFLRNTGQTHAPPIFRKELRHGDQAKRRSTLCQRPGGLVYRHGASRSPIQPAEPARVSGALVTFEPGARTAWHTHPLGQTLMISAGCGLVQRDGGPIEEVRPGDVVWFPAGEKHWHGATATTAMSYIAVQEKLDGKNVDWMEKVSDEQYGR